MTEVPEHLLKRSRDRRAALGLGGGGDGGGGGEAPPAAAASPADEPAPSTAVTPTAAAAPAAATPAEVAAPEPLPPYVEAAVRRKKIPFWAMPVLAFLPVWAIIYFGGLSPAASGKPSQLQAGATIYAARCASCHGGGGGGGVGRVFTGGELIKTFPDIKGQLDFVWLGSNGVGPGGTPYGDPKREGGQHKTLSYNGNPMPAFKDVLKQNELLEVVRYEREVLSGEKVPPNQINAAGELLWPDGKPMLNAQGELITSAGQPLIGPDGKLTEAPSYESGASAPTGP